MNAIPNTKLCWNCEARVSSSQESCSYCGVTIQTPLLEGQRDFAPPYSISGQNHQATPTSPYASKSEEVAEEEKPPQDLVEEEAAEEFKKFLFSMFLMLTGSALLLFGLILAIFSKNGVLTLQWNGELWFVYLILALPMLLIGWRFMQRVSET